MKIQLHSYKVNYSGARRRLSQPELFLILSGVLFYPAYQLENKPFIIFIIINSIIINNIIESARVCVLRCRHLNNVNTPHTHLVVSVVLGNIPLLIYVIDLTGLNIIVGSIKIKSIKIIQ